jgi:hypothetical protein
VSLIPEAVERLRSRIEGSGCEDGVVVLKQNPDASRCQYERGVTLEAHFGGGRGQVVTPHPASANFKSVLEDLECIALAHLPSSSRNSPLRW